MNPESGLYQSLALAADIVVVNVLMILTSLPLLTAGASFRAANYVIAQLVQEEGSQPARTFLTQFTKHVKTSTLWWLITVLLGSLGLLEWLMLDAVEVGANVDFAFRAGLMSAALIVAGISLWLFYFEAKRPRNFTTAFTNSALAALRFLPRTLVGVTMLALPAALAVVVPERWFAIVGFYLIIGLALTLYLFQLLVRHVVSPEE
ncbi:DUF624 domain-containing protein [Trueperella pecoris]|uniref:DUF624 domain-containing protein n=1 Tax=Trueperella pecoris TaxID=2733571 RepID=UPI00186BAB9B|nr:DUF624 domain-containing protein [Trueperella pecoris]QOQ38575.1 YesL family protein [Trueperella pecoris]